MESKNIIWRTAYDIIHHHAQYRPSKAAIIFEDDSGKTELTYKELFNSSRSIANSLIDKRLQGKTVILKFGQGLEFIQTFLGCLIAGVIPVPVNRPAAKEQKWLKLMPIITDSKATTVIGESGYISRYHEWLSKQDGFETFSCFTFDELEGSCEREHSLPHIDADTLAFLQYTSGSTSDPKGAMVSHSNMLSNAALIAKSFNSNSNTVSVSWLPLFHDAGMIGIFMHLLYVGGTMVIIPPAAFVQSPILWLKLITKYKATYTGGPNFGYDLCEQRVSTDQANEAGIDLSSLKGVFNGAEPVRWGTLKKFQNKFEPFGFDFKAFVPCYGMAESTLMITGIKVNEAPVNLKLDKEKLEQGEVTKASSGSEAKILPSCGINQDGTDIIVVDQSDNRVLDDMQEGEIWLRGPSVVMGYFNNPIATKERFSGITECGKGPYLRTGDLGFLHQSHLYVTGRASDLIIVNGKNYYPQDIEETVANSIGCILGDSIAVVSKEIDGEEKVFVIAEVARVALRKLNHALVCQQIKEVVSAEYQLEIEYIALVKPSSILKTTSGKVKRKACLNAAFENALNLVKGGESYACNELDEKPQPQKVLDENGWMQFKRLLVNELSIDEKDIQPSSTLTSLGVNSLKMGALAYSLSQYSDVTVSIEELLELDSIEAFLKSHTWHWDKKVDCFKDYTQPISSDNFPLTDIQTGYVIGRLNQVEMGGVALQSYFEFDGNFCIQQVQRSWNTLISTIPMLRAVIDRTNMQKILSSVPEYHLDVEDITSLSTTQKELRVEEKRANLVSKKLELESWPPFELSVTKLEVGINRLHIKIDGTFFDATSIVKLFASLANIYKERKAINDSPNFGFEHFCRTMKQDEVKYDSSLSFWRAAIKDFPLSPQISSLRVKARHESPNFRRLYKDFKASDLNVLSELGKRWGVTQHAILITAFAQTIATWSLNQRFSISVPMQNRADLDPNMAQAIGHFSTFTLQRFDLRKQISFEQLCLATMGETKALLQNNAISGIELLDLIRQHKEGAFYPVVFTNLLELDSNNSGVEQLENALGELNYSVTRTPQVVLDCQIMKVSHGIRVCWDYEENSFDLNLLNEMFDEYIHGLHHLAKGAVDLPKNDESQKGLQITYQAIEDANNTYVSRREKTLIEGFLSCAEVMPNKVAIIDGERQITYEELLKYSSGVAQVLRNQDCQRGDKVILAQQKGWQQVVFVIAILQAGASFVPVDPTIPSSRLNSIIKRCGSDCLVTDAATKLSSAVCEMVQHVVRFEESKFEVADDVINLARPEDLAYVIFTSGSTGEPKGVAVEHRSAMNTIESVNKIWRVKYDDIVLGLSELSFDLSIYDIFGLLNVGGTVVLAHPLQSPQQWAELIQEHEITIWNTVPATMDLLCDYLSEAKLQLSSIRATQLSGDWFPTSLPQSIRSQLPATEIINMGGATEASIWSIYYTVTGGEQEQFGYIPYGKPLENQQFYLLNEELEPVKPGEVGELFIAGRGLARGYLNDEKKTRDAFFWCERLGQRIYRTGDLGAYQRDGNIRFCGRKDSQVKLNGYRIELGELESACNELEIIKRACAIPYGDVHNRQLALFVTAQNTSEQHLLNGKPTDSESSLYFQRQSMRQFDNTNELEEVTLGKLLASITALTSSDHDQLKYRYPSAGGLYAVHTYIHFLKRVGHLEPGFYVFDSIEHRLEFLSANENLYEGVEFGNIFEITASASFVLYLIADNSQISRKYGVKARDFALLEAGYMSQLLMTTAPGLSLGLCPLGYSEFSDLRSKLLLDGDQDVVHVLAGGPVAQDAYHKGEKSPRISGTMEGLSTRVHAKKIQKLVKNHLANKLPLYMQPKEICVIDHLPLTVNNKVNIKVLVQLLDEHRGAPQSKAVAKCPEGADDDILDYLRSLWKALINDQEIALDDSFIEKGVNSIVAVKMLTRINNQFHIDLALADIFENSSLRKLAIAIKQREYPKIEQDEEVEEGTL